MGALFRDYFDGIKNFSRNVKLYLLALTLNSIGTGMFLVLYNLYLKELSYNEAFVGQTISLKSLAAVLILLPAGVFGDKLGRKKAMLTGALFVAFSFGVLSFMENQTMILIFIFVNGLFNAFFMVAQSPFIKENTNPKERMHLFSINSALMVGSWMIGNLLGGSIPDLLNNWLPTLVSMKITLLLSGLTILLASVPLFKIKEVRTQNKRGFGDIVKILKEKDELKVILKFIFPSAMVGFGAGLFVPYTNLYLSNSFGLSSSSVGFIMAMSQIMTALATLLSPLLVDIVGRVKGIFTFQLSSMPFLFIMAMTTNVYFASVAVLFRAALMNAANPITANLMMETVGDEVKGIANSLSQMAFQLGWAVMGPISGIIIAGYGYKYIFFLSMVFYLLSASSYYLFFRKLDSDNNIAAVS